MAAVPDFGRLFIGTIRGVPLLSPPLPERCISEA
jgi:hypothetical protein